MSEIKREFGERLREFRESTGLSQKEIVDGLSIKSGAWSSYEKGNSMPSIELLNDLAKKYGLDLNWLITGKVNNKKPETIGQALELLFMLPVPEKSSVQRKAEHEELITYNEIDKEYFEEIKNNSYMIEQSTLYFRPGSPLNHLIGEWIHMNDLVQKKTIPADLFDLWKKEKIKEYDQMKL